MTTFMVIPHLLGIMITPICTIDEWLLEYTFQVDAKWWFSDFHHLQENIHLSVDLKCHRTEADLSCRFEKWRLRQRAQKGRDLLLPGCLYMERTIDQEALQKDSRPFQILFDHKGVAGYLLEGNAIPRRMMNLYRIIGNQLNIGVDIVKAAETFRDVEQSNVGLCVVRCTQMTRKPPSTGPVGNLTSFVGCDLENNTITIVKQKILSQCAVLMKRSVTASFWPDFFPKTVASHVLTKSESSMTMSSRSFETLTENEFNLYDRNNKTVGDVSEKVELSLKSYRLLPSDNLITLKEDKIVYYEVLNDETA